MKFHPLKCKGLSLTHKQSENLLPFSIFPYSIDNVILDYVTEQKDLGIIVNSRLTWHSHHQYILNKATTMFNLLRRTCHFVNNPVKKRTLYLTMVRSLFEHGSVVWAPTNLSYISNFEALQKRCIKWILNEQFISYDSDLYTLKLKDLDILPLQYKFIFTDLIVFHKIVHNAVQISLPDYLVPRRPTRQLPYHHLNFSVSDLFPKLKTCLKNNFFIRNLSMWNLLPNTVKELSNFTIFKHELRIFLWNNISQHNDNNATFPSEPD